MTAGPSYEFLWVVGEEEPQRMPARQYMERLFEWAGDIVLDDAVLPSDDRPPSRQVHLLFDQLFRRLIRVLYHIYYHHRTAIPSPLLDNTTKVGSLIKSSITISIQWFVMFSIEHNLIQSKWQFEPLLVVLKKLLPAPYYQRIAPEKGDMLYRRALRNASTPPPAVTSEPDHWVTGSPKILKTSVEMTPPEDGADAQLEPSGLQEAGWQTASPPKQLKQLSWALGTSSIAEKGSSTLSPQEQEMIDLLTSLNLEHYAKNFLAEKININSICLLSDQDLSKLGLAMGDRRVRLLNCSL